MTGLYLELGKGTGRRGEVLELAGETFLVGRSSKCRVRFRSDVVSRRHARLGFDGRTWLVEDLESQNGIYLNGRRVTAAALRPMDSIRFGQANGAEVRVLALDPSPPMGPDEESTPTRFMQAERRTRRRAPARPEPAVLTRHAPPPPDPLPPPPTVAPPVGALETFRTVHVLVGLGMAFGLLTAWGAWGGGFPYVRVAAPVLWALRGLAAAAPGIDPQEGAWLLRFLLALWFGMVGLALERPWKRLGVLVLLGAVHGLAIVAFRL